jgi:tetratricopeptide (TPR) repeat protein
MLGKPKQALAHYRHALGAFPACGRCWMGVAEANAALGEDITSALAKAIEHGSSSTDVRTRAASLLAREGALEDAAQEFSAALGGRKTDVWEFYSLLHRLYDSDYVLDHIIKEADAETYFVYALTDLPPCATKRAYEFFSDAADDVEMREHYVLYLMRRGLVHDAWSIQFDDDRDHGFVDSAFEGPQRFGHFGWKIDSAEGVDADVVRCAECGDDGIALRLRFDGEHNVHYRESRIAVPVTPGYEYRLTARVRYEELTSASGPGILVSGVVDQSGRPERACELWSLSEQFKGSSDWRDVTVEFIVPYECQGIRVYIARPRTQRLDQFVSGDLWIDQINLRVLSTPADRPVEVEFYDDRSDHLEINLDFDSLGAAPEYAIEQRPLALSTY